MKRLFNTDARRRAEFARLAPFPCKNPRESEIAGVCACGASLDRHESRPDIQALPYAEAIWKWMLEVGGFFAYYGGYAATESEDFLQHLAAGCELDYGKSGVPQPGKEQEFNGTFTDSVLYVDVVAAVPYFKCGKYNGKNGKLYGSEKWGIRGDMTLGEIIFQVVRAGSPEDDQ